MAIKEYYAIDPVTNLVVLVTSCEEADAAALYPNYTLIEVQPLSPGVRKYAPGALYLNGKFWYDPTVMGTTAPAARRWTRLEFRRLFTNDELVRLDNYESDELLPIEAKKQLTTFTIHLSYSTEVILTDPLIALGMGFLVGIGYLSEDRKTAILNGDAP